MKTTQVTKTYAVTTSPEVHRKLEMFLALLHYNAGHSGTFGMQFDGDGSDRLRVEPAPDPGLALPAQRIGGVGHGLEFVSGRDYCAVAVEDGAVYRYKQFPDAGVDQLQRRRRGEEAGTVVREWTRTAPEIGDEPTAPHVERTL